MTDALNAFTLFANFVGIPAIAYGCQLALGALGITLIYGVLRFSHFAHSDLMAFGTMSVILCTWALQAAGITLGVLPTALLALPIGIALTALLAIFIDKSVYSFYRQQKAKPVTYVIASIGVMFVLNGLTRFIIGPDDQIFADGVRFVFSAKDFKAWSGLSEGLVLKTTQLITMLVALSVVLWLFWFLQKTKTGKSMRAYSDNEDLALLSGINPDYIVRITWVIAAALAVIAGTLYGLDKSFKPLTYFHLLLPFFAAAIVGGIGNPLGAILGGFVISFSEVMVTYAYKKFFLYFGFESSGLIQFLSTEYKFAVSFIILVVVLLVKPTGLLKGQTI